jgi:hypothetical protein
MVILNLTVSVTKFAPDTLGRELSAVVADTLAANGSEHVMIEWARDGSPGWPPAPRLRYQVSTRYAAGLGPLLRNRVRRIAPTATVRLTWNAHDEQRAATEAGDLRAYQVARLFTHLSGGAVPGRVAQASVDPLHYRRQHRVPSYELVPLSWYALYAALGEADLLAFVDVKARREECLTALGRLRILPEARVRVAEGLDAYAALLDRCRDADRADDELRGGTEVRTGTGLPSGLHSGTEVRTGTGLRADGPTGAVRDLLAALPVRLLYLDNGDEPGFLAARPDWAEVLLGTAEPAGIPFRRA